MKRVYDQGDAIENVQYFLGTEVEHTPQYGKKTLFVVGANEPEDIMSLANEHGCKHIYCGANMSFNVLNNTISEWQPWEAMVLPLLSEGFWVTLDVEVSQVEGLLESGFTEHNRFIPMISVRIPYIGQLGYNACLKIDDKDFDKSNPGVWVHRMHDLKDKSKFTDWSKYTRDEIIS